MSRASWILSALLASALAALVIVTTPEPRSVRASRLHREQAAGYCAGFTLGGLPCNRRVRGGGYCWQHRGEEPARPVMLRL